MSTSDPEQADGFTRADVTPVTVPASALDSTAPEDLRDLKYEFASEGRIPAHLTLTATFEEDGSFATRDEVDRVREYVRAAAFLGAGRLTVSVREAADESKVETTLRACAEHARREGVRLDVDGPVAI